MEKTFIIYGRVVKEWQRFYNPFERSWDLIHDCENSLKALRGLFIHKNWEDVTVREFYKMKTYMESPVVGDYIFMGNDRHRIVKREVDLKYQVYHLYTDHILERIPEDEKKTQALQEEMNAVEEQILDYFQGEERGENSKKYF